MSEETEKGNPVHIYVIRTGRPTGFYFRVDYKQTLIRFDHSRFETDDVKLAESIDKALKIAAISMNVMKVDKAAAELVVKQHQLRRGVAAAKGGLTAEMARGMQEMAGTEANNELASIVNPDLQSAAAMENLVITDTVADPVVVPAAIPKPPEKSGLNLGAGLKVGSGN